MSLRLSRTFSNRFSLSQEQGSEVITGYKGMMVQSKPGPKDQFDE